MTRTRKMHDRPEQRPFAAVRIGLVAGLLVMALSLVSGARADLDLASLDLNAITIVDGVVEITGTVGDATADLRVNGAPIDVDALGNFTALVDLDENVVVFSLLNDLGEQATIRIPVDVLVENGGEGILNDLLDAEITVNVPEEGFQFIDGNGPMLSGSVGDADLLESMTVNDIDVLDRLGPGGGFSIVLPWSNRPSAPPQVTVVVIDRRGVSQSSTFRTVRVSSVIRTRAGASVSAAGARGVVVAKVHLDRSTLKWSKRVGVSVTVKDRRGRLVRGAALRLTGLPSRYVATGATRAGFTNRLGQARFTYRLHPRAFANCGCKRFAVIVRASTPRAAAKKTAALRVPAPARG